MNTYRLIVSLVVVFAVTVALFVSFRLFAFEADGESISVSAMVLPERILVIDAHGDISAVISNTQEDVRPTVRLNDMEGAPLPYTDRLAEQYRAPMQHIDFSKTGTVYKKEPYGFTRMLSRFVSRVFEVLF